MIGKQDIRIHHDITRDIETLIIPLALPEAVLQDHVQDLVHQDKVQFPITQLLQEVRSEEYPLPVCGCRLTVLIQRKYHMHKKQPIESVVHEDPHSGKQQPLHVFRYLLI